MGLVTGLTGSLFLERTGGIGFLLKVKNIIGKIEVLKRIYMVEINRMGDYPCNYCNKKFLTKYYFDHHIFWCQFIHKSKSEKQREMNYNIPNNLISDILHRMERLETDNKKLKDEVRLLKRKQRIHLEQFLNSESGPVPIQTLREWIKNIPLTTTHLEIVFKSDLLTAMMTCIREALESMDTDGIPCCAFIQKQFVLYSYENREKSATPIWGILVKDELLSILNVLASRFLSLYLKYSNEPSPAYANLWDENQTIYLRKVVGRESCEDTRVKCIKEYLYNTLKRNFVEIEIL